MIPKRMVVSVVVGAVVWSGAWGNLFMQAGDEKTIGAAWAADTATPAPKGVGGKIVSVDGDKVIVKTFPRGGGEPTDVTVPTNDKTVLNVDGKEGKLSDLKPGMYTSIALGEGGVAAKIYARTPQPGQPTTPKPPTTTKGRGGKVVSVDGANVVVKTWAGTGKETKEVTVTTDDKTVVVVDDKEGKVSDLKPDMYVSIIPAEGTATKIVARTPRQK